MREFEEFVAQGIVKRQSSNKHRAVSLQREARNKKEFLELSFKNIPREKMNANFVVDYCYDILMELIRAKLHIDGFNSSGSHEAEVSYLKNLGFSQKQVLFMDEIRYFRNGTKYYGTILSQEYAQKVMEFTEELYPKLTKIVDQSMEKK